MRGGRGELPLHPTVTAAKRGKPNCLLGQIRRAGRKKRKEKTAGWQLNLFASPSSSHARSRRKRERDKLARPRGPNGLLLLTISRPPPRPITKLSSLWQHQKKRAASSCAAVLSSFSICMCLAVHAAAKKFAMLPAGTAVPICKDIYIRRGRHFPPFPFSYLVLVLAQHSRSFDNAARERKNVSLKTVLLSAM